MRDIAEYIARLNTQEQYHIGFCGTNASEIEAAFSIEFSDVPFAESYTVSYLDGKVNGVLAFNLDLNREVAEIWGPFAEDFSVVQGLYEELLAKLPLEIKTLQLFLNVKNMNGLAFAKDQGYIYQSSQIILVFSLEDFSSIPLFELGEEHYNQFVELHDLAFPNTYYSGNQILERLGEKNRLFGLTDGSLLIGYVYVEAEPSFD